MINDRDDKYENQDEGEYHFSDDQINYETETTEPESSAGGKPTVKSITQNLLGKSGNYRRMLIGAGVFLVLIFLVYKMVAPTSSPPPTEFSAGTAGKPTEAGATNVPVTTTIPPAAAPTPVAQQPAVQQPAAQPQFPTQAAMQPEAMPAPPIQAAPMTAPMMPEAGIAPPQPTQPLQQAPEYPTQPSGQLPQQSTIVTPPPAMPHPGATPTPPPAEYAVAQKTTVDKLAVLEEQNAKIMHLLQSQFAEKMADYETRNRFLEAKLNALDKRMAELEAGGATRRAQATSIPKEPHAPKVTMPKTIYTVQAIIPGRAWLKSETGETVTVSEGDILKDYGKVVKIDPYDGIVEINIGNKIIALSYGSGS